MTDRNALLQSALFDEKVYAGVLGKIIGVYHGRPVEGWSNERIEREHGELAYHVHAEDGIQIVETDDDITGTFIFARGLSENGYDPNLSPAQIGDWWLNTIIEDKTILWWGGLGTSSEHTAYLRLKSGVSAPQSGSIALNGKTVAEQIGAEIFVDGWGMLCAGDPVMAADFARRAGSVSHDGEAIYAAQVIAAMDALAFVEPDINTLLSSAYGLVPADCTIAAVIRDIREWVESNGDDWRATLRQVIEKYGYDKFPGMCHVVPNCSLIVLALLHGKGDFHRSLMIVNTCGYDTDCNSGNVGCLLGIRSGLMAFENGPDWRGPVADRLYLPCGVGSLSVTDAVRESDHLTYGARRLAGLSAARPKSGARFHFSRLGSVQGFRIHDGNRSLSNPSGKLRISFDGGLVSATTPTLPLSTDRSAPGYACVGCPTLYPGQAITADLTACKDLLGTVAARLVAVSEIDPDRVIYFHSDFVELEPGESRILEFVVPDTGGHPYATVGIEIDSMSQTGFVDLDWLTWDGVPTVECKYPAEGGSHQQAWVSSADTLWIEQSKSVKRMRVVKNRGQGLVQQGGTNWTDYAVTTTIVPHLFDRAGVAIYVQGLRRFVAVTLLPGNRVALVEQFDSSTIVMEEAMFNWTWNEAVAVSVSTSGGKIDAKVGNVTLHGELTKLAPCGAIGLVVDSGSASFGATSVRPVMPS